MNDTTQTTDRCPGFDFLELNSTNKLQMQKTFNRKLSYKKSQKTKLRVVVANRSATLIVTL